MGNRVYEEEKKKALREYRKDCEKSFQITSPLNRTQKMTGGIMAGIIGEPKRRRIKMKKKLKVKDFIEWRKYEQNQRSDLKKLFYELQEKLERLEESQETLEEAIRSLGKILGVDKQSTGMGIASFFMVYPSDIIPKGNMIDKILGHLNLRRTESHELVKKEKENVKKS